VRVSDELMAKNCGPIIWATLWTSDGFLDERHS
jgi:hypothetical protein